MKHTVLLAGCDASLAVEITQAFRGRGFDVRRARDGEAALSKFGETDFDLLVLDMDGAAIDPAEVCRHIRRHSDVPIAILTDNGDGLDAALVLEAGADDYVRKPVEAIELLARARALIRRRRAQPAQEIVAVDGIRIYPKAFRVVKDGQEIHLSPTEFKLLLEMARRPGQVFTRAVLLDLVWSYDYAGESRVVDVAVKRLRNKIEDDPTDPVLIQTVRGIGYRLECDPPATEPSVAPDPLSVARPGTVRLRDVAEMSSSRNHPVTESGNRR